MFKNKYSGYFILVMYYLPLLIIIILNLVLTILLLLVKNITYILLVMTSITIFLTYKICYKISGSGYNNFRGFGKNEVELNKRNHREQETNKKHRHPGSARNKSKQSRWEWYKEKEYQEIAEELEEMDAILKPKPIFKVSKPPTCKKTFLTPNEDIIEFDCMGNPYCGYVCIDIASSNEINLKHYEEWCEDNINMGKIEDLVQYAKSRGVNIKFIFKIEQDYDDILFCNEPSWNWVYLIFSGDKDNGHYSLGISKYDDNKPVIRDFSWIKNGFELPLIGITEDVVLLSSREVNDKDRRCFTTKIDTIKANDITSVYFVKCWFVLFWFKIMLISEQYFEVSNVLLAKLNNEMQSLDANGLDVFQAMGGVGPIRGLNMDNSVNDLYINTSVIAGKTYKGKQIKSFVYINILNNLLHIILKFINPNYKEDSFEKFKDFRNYAGFGINIYESQCQKLAFNEEDIDAIRINQNNCKNYVINYNLRLEYTNKKVAVAPLGPVLTNNGVVAIGEIPMTNSISIFSAFVLRSMSKNLELRDKLLVKEFVEFSKNFLNRFIDDAKLDRKEPDNISYFVEMYSGKKTLNYIKQTVDNYIKYNKGLKTSKNFFENSCFVKFENSGKFVGKELKTKPRLIMTMSPKMIVECCPVMLLIEAFNNSSFSEFHIKNLEPKEMINRIIEHSYDEHMVSDYSSFESSIDEEIREIELYVLTQLCIKFGYNNTLSNILKVRKGRQLKTRYGRFYIRTRCSGDFWTSFGNALINVCLMAFSHHKNFGSLDNFKFLAEGDDGLVPVKSVDVYLINRLGFKFSLNVYGKQPGDCDFLSSLWVNGKRYINIAKSFSTFYVKKGSNLKRSKQLFLLRCAALSLYHISPGHPVTTAIVNRILKETRGMTRFKGYESYLDEWGKSYEPIKMKYVMVDETMRHFISVGAEGFPPISVSHQLILEHNIMNNDLIYISDILNTYDIMKMYVTSNNHFKPMSPNGQGDVVNLANIINELKEVIKIN